MPEPNTMPPPSICAKVVALVARYIILLSIASVLAIVLVPNTVILLTVRLLNITLAVVLIFCGKLNVKFLLPLSVTMI